jgi:hypothetical protein
VVVSTGVGAGGLAGLTGRSRRVVALRTLVRTSPRRRRAMTSQPVLLGGLTGVAGLYMLAAVAVPQWFPLATVVVWVLVGGFFLRLRFLVAYFGVLATAAATAMWLRPGPAPQPGVVVALVVSGLLVLGFARSRERVGLQGSLGDSMLVDLRARLQSQGVVPALGPGWDVETVLRPAFGDTFSGDFFVASRSADHRVLEVVLVDVSGKGQRAGTRALLLSGAFGGLLGALPGQDFLPAANAYLLRQHWDEGFATAVHLAVDLETGAFRVASAGHPPPVRFRRGSGRWDVIDGGRGPLLGVLPAPAFPAHEGVLERGDALLLYTDGLVESRTRDIAVGIDRLVGQAERVVASGFGGGAARIVDGTCAGESDDRALVLIRRP